MKIDDLSCQVCLTRYTSVSSFKKHARSMEHQQKIANVFQKDKVKVKGFFPSITLLKPLLQPTVGISLLTVCFSTETHVLFYLCHACMHKCPSDWIMTHLSSSDHCSNYFSYTNPNVLRFAWLPSMNMKFSLKPQVTEEVRIIGLGQLQMLHLPCNLLNKLETCTYSEVMHTLCENDKLLKLLKAVEPKRMMIQAYHEDRNRKHPLLGMQHLVECICVGPTDKRYYLCTLCKLTLATHTIIKHVLSFDHIFCYFRAWHPSTLLSRECYMKYTMAFASMILDFAKQSEKIHGTANIHMKQVHLEPAKSTSVNFNCYAEALKELESITKENKDSSLVTSVQPGSKLECRSGSVQLSYKMRCQDCNVIFENIVPFMEHLSNWKHKEMMKKAFRGQTDGGFDQTGWKLYLGLYTFIIDSLKQNQPAIGVPLVVTCVSTQAQEEAIYVCFACNETFTEALLRQHFNSQKHLIHTLLHENPWQLSFAWEKHLDVKLLRSKAREEEKQRGPDEMMMKVLDIPSSIFCPVPLSFSQVMKRLELHHALLKREVPQCETYSKLNQNERFPLLGNQFLVMYDVCASQHQPTKTGYLCLLCKRRLSDDECDAHVFSSEHVSDFLNSFHPGSLTSSTDPETLLDLAKQAARNHQVLHMQVIKLDRPIMEPCSYHTAISILGCVKRKNRNGKLEPPITPTIKLFSRRSLKQVDKNKDVRENSQENGRMIEGSENTTSQKSTDSQTSMKNISLEAGAEIPDTQTPTPSEKESDGTREVFSQTTSEEIKNVVTEAVWAIKEEKVEEPVARERIESCQNTDKDDETKIKEEPCTSSKTSPTQENERKRPSSMDNEIDHKRQRLTYKQEPQNLPGSEQKETTTADEEGSGKTSHEPAKVKASSIVDHQQPPHLWQYIKRKDREPVVGQCFFKTYLFKSKSETSKRKSDQKVCGNGKLEPPITPTIKLFSRRTLKEVDKDKDVRENSQENGRMIEGSENTTSQKSTDSQTSMKNISVEAGAEIPDTQTPTPSEKESDGTREVFLQTTSEEIKNVVIQAVRAIKEEKVEEPVARERIESCQNTDKDDETKIKEEPCTSSKTSPTQEKERKRPSSMDNEIDHKRQWLTYTQEPQNLPSSEQKETTTADEGGSGKTSHEPAKVKASSIVDHQQPPHLWQYIKRKDREPVVGLNALVECHCDQRDPIYLCACCSLMIPEKDVIAHVTGVDHQKMFLEKLLPPLEGKTIRDCAALFEQDKGFGDAQVVELDKDIYNKISKQNFESAMQTVKALHAQQDSWSELPSIPDLSGVQPVDNSVTLHARHKGYPGTDDHTVVAMEVDHSADCEAQPSSVAPAVSAQIESSSSTTEVPPESNEDFKVSESADDTNACLTVSTSSEGTSSGHVSTRWHHGSTGSSLKVKFTSNSSVGPQLKTATTMETVGTSQSAASSNSVVTTPPASMTDFSKSTAKAFTSPPHTTISTATISKPTNASSSSATAVTKSCVATTPSVAATTTKSMATASVSTAASSKAPGPTFTSSGTVSRTASTTKSASVTKLLESSTGTAAMVIGTSYKAATACNNRGSTVVREATCRSAPATKIKSSSNDSETVSKTTVKRPSSVATAKMTQMSDSCENTEASAKPAHVKKYSVGSNTRKSSAPADRHLATLTSAWSENKSPPTEPPRTSTSETKRRERPPTVGLNQLIVVTCKEKQQLYCQLCSLRLQKSSHKFDLSHQSNYIKMKFPQWVAKSSDFENKLKVTVAHLAEAEKDVVPQTLDVEIDVYQELKGLPVIKVIERLKAMLRQRGSRLSSPTTNTAEVLRQQVAFASPFDASSPDGEATISQEEGQSDGAPSWKSAEPEAAVQISDQLHSRPTLNANDPEPIATAGSQNTDTAADKIEKPKGGADLLVPSSGRAGRFCQTPDNCPKTTEKGQQPETADPELQDTRMVPESSEKTSPLQFFDPDPSSSAASENTPQSIPTRCVPKHPESSLGPVPHSVAMTGAIGELTAGRSLLSTYLKVKGLDMKSIIGLGSMWECQGISLPSFYLCESCRKMLANSDICQHMISDEHRVKYMLEQHPGFMSFWQQDNLTLEMKLSLSREIVPMISTREPLETIDAQSVMLNKEMYELVHTAPFSEGSTLKLLQNIKKQKVSTLCLPTSASRQKYQQPEDRQGGEESLITDMQSAQALERDQRCENEARPKTEKWHLEKSAKVGDSNGVKQRRVSSPLDISSVDSKADSVVRLEEHLPAKDTRSSLQPVRRCQSSPEYTTVNPTAPSTFPSPDKSAGPGSDEYNASIVDVTEFENLMALMRERKAQLNLPPYMSAPYDAETTASSANNSSQSGLERRCDPKSQLLKTPENTNPPSAKLFKTMCLATAPLASDPEDQLDTPNANSANISSFEEAEPVVATLPPTCAADPSHPQHQRSAEVDSTGAGPLPISAIITARPEHIKKRFTGGYNGQNYTEMNRGTQVAHSFSTVVASEGYGQYSQMDYTTNENSGYLSSEAVTGYTPADNPPVYPGSLYQREWYDTGGLYPSQIYSEQEANHFSL